MIEAAILAAGEGKRLQPITKYLPKTLLPIVTRPLLENIIVSLRQQGIEKICINVHHFRKKMLDFIRKREYGKEIEISIEDRILGTGGGIGRMRRFLENENFVVHNGDIITDIYIDEAYKFHKERNGLVTLLIQKGENSKDIKIEEDGRIIDIGQRLKPEEKEREHFDFTGIAILNRKIFNFLPEDDFHDIIDTYTNLITEGEDIFGFICRDNYWIDIGTKENYLLVHKKILLERKKILSNFILPDTPFFVGAASNVSKKAKLSGFVSIGKDCSIGDCVQLSNCVVFDNTVINSGKSFSNCIISNDFVVQGYLC